jgi:predicted RNA methylase
MNISNLQEKGLKRNTIDKFYTKNDIVKIIIPIIKNKLNINKNDLIIEPSAGNGVFIDEIKNITNNYLFFDIEPEHNDIIKKDYLLYDFEEIKKNVHIIGNPPFGRQSSLAIKFIKKSCEFANSISFILPKSFKKDSMKKHFFSNFHLLHEIDLPENSFLINNQEYNVPCILQIWELKNFPRKIIPKNIPFNFKFVNKTDNPDISFRRVGVNAGKISKDYNDKSEQSHYFIKFENNKNENIEKLNNIKFEFNNTVGPKSISKQEVIMEFNKILKS